MRRLAYLTLLLFVLAVPASASATDWALTITATGEFSPTHLVIKPGDTVTVANNSIGHSIQYSDETSPRCTITGLPDCQRSFPDPAQIQFFDPTTCSDANTCSMAGNFHGDVIVDGTPSIGTLTGPPSAERNQQVTFSATVNNPPDGDTITSFNWDFGDGLHGSTPGGDVQHTYANAGTYTVTVTATDSRNNTSAPAQISIDITVPDRDGDGVDDDNDLCPDVAAPGQPNGCPPPPPIIVPPEITSTATVARTLGITGVLRSGVSTVLTCSDSCTAVFTLLNGTTTFGTTTASITGPGAELVTVPLTTKISSKKSAQLRLVAVVTDALARVQTLTETVSVKPVKSAGKLPAVGISDQNVGTFSDPLFQILRLKYARLVTPWNAITKEPARLDAWLQAARLQGVRPLVSFEHSRSNLCPAKPCKAPSVGQYKKAWRAFHKKYSWVKDISPWDEVNSSTQPTGRHPELAAAYYNVVRASCRGCSVVAADVLDLNNMRRYLQAFLAKAKGKPRLWGLHNYRDTNRFRQTGTKQLLAMVKGQVWFTETGGIVSFTTAGGKKALPKSESRAKRAMDFMFKLAELDAKRVKRIYVYQWKVNFQGDRFDAGVVRPDGRPRPSYDVLTLNASSARKR